MGTRADFYIGRGASAEWLGSIAWDGYPHGIDDVVLDAATEADYREQVAGFLSREDGTTPDMGWPWPWDDSRTTDYAYAFEDGKVLAWCVGWFDPKQDEPEHYDGQPAAVFPDMSGRRNMTLGPRSGVIVFGGPA